MSILRQPTREAMKAAVAACRGRLFAGFDGVGSTSDYSDRVKGSRTTMPISRVLEPNHWRGG
jgi:hypothetical protein